MDVKMHIPEEYRKMLEEKAKTHHQLIMLGSALGVLFIAIIIIVYYALRNADPEFSEDLNTEVVTVEEPVETKVPREVSIEDEVRLLDSLKDGTSTAPLTQEEKEAEGKILDSLKGEAVDDTDTTRIANIEEEVRLLDSLKDN